MSWLSVRTSLLQRLLDDRLAGRVASVEEYVALFPDYEEQVRAEYEQLQSSETSAPRSASRASDDPQVRAFVERYESDLAAGLERHLIDYVREFPDIATQIPGAMAAVDEVRRRSGSVTDREFVGPYRLLRLLGGGGQGTVYVAEDPRLARRVALKVLPDSSLASPRALERLRREAAVAARLQHPGLCAVYDAGVADGVPYVAMALLSGRSIAEWLRAEPVEGLSRDEILRRVGLIEEAARAIHAAHEAGIVHRDLKPGNVQVTDEGHAVILDFGLARDEQSDVSLTNTGDVFGTPAYMAPEQVSGRRAGPGTDVYALGVTLYELVTGTRLHDAPTREALFHAILTRPPPDVRARAPRAPRDLTVVLATALAKNVGHRYRTAHDLAEDLRAVRESRPIAARRPTVVARLARWVRRDPVQAGLSAALVLAMVAAAGFGGFVLAKSPALREGERVLQAQELDSLMLSALEYSGLNSLSGKRLQQQIELRPEHALPRVVEALLQARIDPEWALELATDLPEPLEQEPAFATIRAHVEGGLELDPQDVTGSALDDFVRGWIAHERHRMGEDSDWLAVGRRFLDRALLRSPRAEILFHHQRAEVLNLLGEERALIDAAHAMHELWPERAASWYWLGRARWLSGDVEGAAVAQREAVRLDETHLPSRFTLAGHEIELGNVEASTRVYEEAAALTLATAGREVWKKQVVNHVLILGIKRHYDVGIEVLREALEEVDDPELRTLLARHLNWAGRYPEAIDEMNALLIERPEDREASRMLCWALEALEDWPALTRELRRRVAVDPEDGTAWMNLAYNTWEDDKQAFVEAAREAMCFEESILSEQRFVENTAERYQRMVDALLELESEGE